MFLCDVIKCERRIATIALSPLFVGATQKKDGVSSTRAFSTARLRILIERESRIHYTRTEAAVNRMETTKMTSRLSAVERKLIVSHFITTSTDFRLGRHKGDFHLLRCVPEPRRQSG